MVGLVEWPTCLLIFGGEDENSHEHSWWHVFYINGNSIFDPLYTEPRVERKYFDEYEKVFGKIKESDIHILSKEEESDLREELCDAIGGMNMLYESLDYVDDCQEVYVAIEALNTRAKKKIHQFVKETYL
jgi:hypothetical protein